MPYKDKQTKLQYDREYAAAHREYAKKKARLWRLNNPKKSREYSAKRRAIYRKDHPLRKIPKEILELNNKIASRVWKIRQRTSMPFDKTLLLLLQQDNIQKYGVLSCYLCEKPILKGKDHIEHRLPKSRGGDNSYANLAIACGTCNRKKSNKTVEEYCGHKNT